MSQDVSSPTSRLHPLRFASKWTPGAERLFAYAICDDVFDIAYQQQLGGEVACEIYSRDVPPAANGAISSLHSYQLQLHDLYAPLAVNVDTL